jgi:hypothetical protein
MTESLAEKVVRASGANPAQTVSADTLPAYRAEVTFTHDAPGAGRMSAVLHGPAAFLATAVAALADAFRDEAER